jgi:hypothetical protein
MENKCTKTGKCEAQYTGKGECAYYCSTLSTCPGEVPYCRWRSSSHGYVTDGCRNKEARANATIQRASWAMGKG